MNPLEKHKTLFTENLKQVDQKIIDVCNSKVPLITALVTHIINSGGKRLRPVLLILSAKLCGSTSPKIIDLAACVELLHTATLFHDDVVDSSKMRRGRKTANELWGNAASVLVGDFLLAQAFSIMSSAENLEIIETLSKTSSVITEGEVSQLSNKNNIEISFDDYLQIITAKTAALLASCCKVGAIIAEQSNDIKNALDAYGLNLGIAFQITDDLLDYTSTAKNMGKKTGDDFREGKITLPIIHTLQNCDANDKQFLTELFPDISKNSKKLRSTKALDKTKNIIEKSGGFEYTKNQAVLYAKKAQEALNLLPNNQFKLALTELLEFSVNREF